MAIFSKSLEAARKDAEKAQQLVTDWESKASDARAHAVELDANSGALILADESAAESISLQIQNLERKSRAFDQATVEAEHKLQTAHRKVLECEAKEEDRLATDARKTLDAHNAKVEALLSQLKEVDGCDYTIGRMIEGYGAEIGERQIPNSVSLRRRQVRHSTRAAVLRYFIRTGEIAGNYYALNNELGTNFNGLGASIAEVDGIPGIVGEYRAAGLTFAKAGA